MLVNLCKPWAYNRDFTVETVISTVYRVESQVSEKWRKRQPASFLAIHKCGELLSDSYSYELWPIYIEQNT